MRGRTIWIGLLLLCGPVRAADVPFGPPGGVSTTALSPRWVHTADLDGDGDVDVLSASANDSKIAWHENRLNEASADFTERIISTSALIALSVHAGDLDGDGDVDVLSASTNDSKIAWYENRLNEATADFLARTISTSAAAAQSVYAADLDGDGDPDVLSASALDDTIAWYENRLDEAPADFRERTISTAAVGAQSVHAADVDADGDLDVLSASSGDNKIAWYENRLDEVSADFVEEIISTTAVSAQAVYASDVDGDGDVDVLSASSGDDKIAWYENRLDEVSADFAETIISSAADGAQSVFAADVDRDGDVDVLSASSDDDTIAWYENDGSQGFTEAVLSAAASSARSVLADDLDGDGDVDVVSASAFDNTIAWFENRTIHSAAPFSSAVSISDAAVGARAVLAVDLDGDGDMDALSASAIDDKVAWYENDGGQIFTEASISITALDTGAVFAVDLDGDGDVDVLSASALDDTIAWYENDGSEGFSDHVISTTANSAQSVHAADVDGDGDVDVLSASQFDDKIAWYENDGSQGFSERAISTGAEGARAVCTADVDRDGDVDVLSASALDDKIAWYENDGTQTFTERLISAAADGAQSVCAADVDRDGDMDVLSASAGDDKIAWYENDGSQGFVERVISMAADGAQSVYATDVDGDGDVDVLSASLPDDKIAWYENDGALAFTERVISTAADSARSVHAADVDGDGDVDVLSASADDDTIAWFENARGQYGFTSAYSAPALVCEQDVVSLLTVDLAHKGRVGDSDEEWAALGLMLVEGPGDPLTADEANALIEWLHLYRDDGSGVFDAADALVMAIDELAPVDGVQTILVPDGHPDARVAGESTARFFVVVQIAVGAMTAVPTRVEYEHLEIVSSVEDAATDRAVRSVPIPAPGATSSIDARDSDNDGFEDGCDCAPGDNRTWAVPPAVDDVLAARDPVVPETVLFGWSQPGGGEAPPMQFDVLRSSVAGDFDAGGSCVATDSNDAFASDPDLPLPDEVFHYLIRVENPCDSALGPDATGVERTARSCDP